MVPDPVSQDSVPMSQVSVPVSNTPASVSQAPLHHIQHPFAQGYHIPRVPAASTYRRQDDEESLHSDFFPGEDLARMEVCQQWLAHIWWMFLI